MFKMIQIDSRMFKIVVWIKKGCFRANLWYKVEEILNKRELEEIYNDRYNN